MMLLIRALAVFRALLPFLFSVIRDHRRFIVFGGPRPLTEAEREQRAAALSLGIASLGPTFIKLAQVLAMREDMFPKLYCDAFKSLQDRVPPFPYAQLRNIVEAEFGRPLEEVYDAFEPEPIAAASLGQVHRAMHRGERVAVKVLRPDVEKLVTTDLTIMRGSLLVLRAIFRPRFYMRNLWTLIGEFARVIYQEMDFVREASQIELFRRNFEHMAHVIIPEIHQDASSRRVLTLKFYEGVRVDDTEALRAIGIDPMQLVRMLVCIYTRMVVIDGLMHADPHPGNLLVDRQGNIIILDYGMVIHFPMDVKMELLRTTIAAVRGDINTMITGFYKLRMVEPGTNFSTLRDAARTLLTINFTSDFTPRQIQRIGEDILKVFHVFPIHLPSGLVYLLRVGALIEGIGISFNPHFNGVRFATPVVRDYLKDLYLEPEGGILSRLLDYALKILEFFSGLSQVVSRAEREELHVRMHRVDMYEIEGYFAALQRRILFGMFAVAIAIVSGMIYVRFERTQIIVAGIGIVVLIFAGLIAVPARQGWKE